MGQEDTPRLKNLRASDGGWSDRIFLEWDYEKVDVVRVYRSLSPHSCETKHYIGETAGYHYTYSDMDANLVAGQTYYYGVTAQDEGQKISACSNVDAGMLWPVAKVQGVVASGDLIETIKISWQAVDSAVTYHVFQGDRVSCDHGMAIKIGEVDGAANELELFYGPPKNGEIYPFTVQAEDSYGNLGVL